jgi:hypothetical protein
MMKIAKILSLTERVEAQRRRTRSIPANDNDPKGPPPAAAARIPSPNQDERTKMHHYDFAVLKDDETIAALKSLALPDLKAAWSQVTELAKTIEEPGSRIRVTNRDGEVEILAGVSIARGDFVGAQAA